MEKDLFSIPDEKGYLRIVDVNNKVMEYVHMDYLRLSEGQNCELGMQDREIGLLLLGGNIKIRSGKKEEKIKGRKDSFSGLPHAVYVPAGETIEVTAMSEFEAVIFGTPAKKGKEIIIIYPEDIEILTIGQDNWAIQGYFVIGSDFPAEKLIIGETQIPKGNWCSVPPHSHDKDISEKETKLEEIYLFKFKPLQGFGFQGLYNDDRSLDKAYIIRENSVVLIPEGYHPNVSGPGYEMRMFWGMGGLNRNWIPFEDPDHKWLGESSNAPSDVAWE